MRTRIDVKNRKEAEAIHRAMAEPDIRAFVLVTGTLLTLPSDRARARVLSFVADQADEERASVERATP